ncbi:hypothetical protein [Nitrosospira multiformis]|uniref:hypothetical protein n=1 Tax=Nitrosospira multiformis TaxID=1231 RepID=UPI0011B28CCE|nr:hypothetical protein [Nitrosospira multiformis]
MEKREFRRRYSHAYVHLVSGRDPGAPPLPDPASRVPRAALWDALPDTALRVPVPRSGRHRYQWYQKE